MLRVYGTEGDNGYSENKSRVVVVSVCCRKTLGQKTSWLIRYNFPYMTCLPHEKVFSENCIILLFSRWTATLTEGVFPMAENERRKDFACHPVLAAAAPPRISVPRNYLPRQRASCMCPPHRGWWRTQLNFWISSFAPGQASYNQH